MKRYIFFLLFALSAEWALADFHTPPSPPSSRQELSPVMTECHIDIIDDTTYDFYRHEYLRHRKNALLFAGIGLPVSAGLYASAWYTMMGVFSISGIAGAAISATGIVVEAVKSHRYRERMAAMEPVMDSTGYRLRK